MTTQTTATHEDWNAFIAELDAWMTQIDSEDEADDKTT